ncbi:MAG TPA: glycosyltransferase family protein [Bacillota bacterium]|nr:glycosyltransferase family protein [Bacillota bacterium]
MKVVAIVQARMTSTRLPGKILLEVMDKPLLAYQMERLRQVPNLDEIWLATTSNATDDLLEKFGYDQGIPIFRGSEDDVLSRYYHSATRAGADVVVRITSDCPLIDPEVVEQIVGLYLQNQDQYDYVSNTLERSYPRGMDIEVFSFRALEQAFNEGHQQYEREHVTPYIYQHPDLFRLKNVKLANPQDEYRWTVDTEEDFLLIKLILENIYPVNRDFRLQDILTLLAEHPEWSAINAHIEQKKLQDG